jgi:hypothetical protein
VTSYLADLRRQSLTQTPSTGILTRRCNPFGFATDAGAKHLMGGLFGPEHVGSIKWNCENPADGRYRLTCRCEHDGPVTELCLPHVAQIDKRMAETCPRCVMPPKAVALWAADQSITALITEGMRKGMAAGELQRLLARKEANAHAMNELLCMPCLTPGSPPHPHAEGIIHRCHCTPREIS